MSTQDDSGILFEISNEQQNFRLLELPPSLLSLIASKDPPKYVRNLNVCDLQDADMPESLCLKSVDSLNANDQSKQPGLSAVLCTDDHTFQLRQVQSSNSVFVLQPSESRRDDNNIPASSLLAIAQCTSTLELVPSDTAASFATVSRLLQTSLPPYNGTDTDVELDTNSTLARTYKDKNTILEHAPFSTVEFNETWKQLCAFEVLDRAWLPTPSALAELWKSILSAATIRGVKLDKTFDLKSLAEMVGNDGYPQALVMAVVTRLVLDTEQLTDNYVVLCRDKTVQWVGKVCLQRAGASGIPQSDFLAQWHDGLPEGWRKHASMDLLKAKFSHPDPSKERIVFNDDIHNATSPEILPSAGGKANRKWHDKFKVGRK